MAVCIPFLSVTDIVQTIKWYESIDFKCTATNQIWEPGGELNWARIEWENAPFMIGPDERDIISENKDSALWFNVDAIDDIISLLKNKKIKIDLEPETFYGRKVVSFKDINGFRVSFSCELK